MCADTLRACLLLHTQMAAQQANDLQRRTTELQARAAEVEALSEEHTHLQAACAGAEQLLEQVQALREAAAALPELQQELGELQGQRDALSAALTECEQLQAEVAGLQQSTGRLALADLRREAAAVRAEHEEALALATEVKAKVGVVSSGARV